tara:strand:- start:11 stop:1312 length:1302 start_codon:yes stop_codon:yes gene_type:complete
MKYYLIIDTISGLVAADKLSEKNFQIDLLIPENSNFNGFNSKKLQFGSRLFELETQKNDNSNKDISEYIPQYKGHRNFIQHVAPYLKDLFLDKLIVTPDPKLVESDEIYSDFLYGDYFEDLIKYLDFMNDINSKSNRFLINNYSEYTKIIENYKSYKDLSKMLHPSSIDKVINNLLNKLSGKKDIISKFHRILWLPILWDSTINDYHHLNDKKLTRSKFYRPQNEDFNFVEELIKRIQSRKNVNLEYFKVDDIRFQDKKIKINKTTIQDNDNVIISLAFRYFEHIFEDKEEDIKRWGFSIYNIKRDYLLKEFSQLTFDDSSLPYRVSYKFDNDTFNLCIEKGTINNNDNKLFNFLIKNGYLSEKFEFEEDKYQEFSIPFKLPTKKNEEIFNYKTEKINSILNKSIKLSPLSFYQSSALNEQIAEGLSIGSKLN